MLKADFNRDELCTCGQPFRDCPFWTAALGRFEVKAGVSFKALQHAHQQIARYRHWPKSVILKDATRRYQQQLAHLYRAIYQASDNKIIVDSSKGPLHAHLLRSTPSIDMTLLHFIRDSRAYAYSMRRWKRRPEMPWTQAYMPRQSSIVSALAWVAVNFLLEALQPDTRFRYEVLATDPTQALRCILADLNLPIIPAEDLLTVTAENHMIRGNPMRFQEQPLRIRLDHAWETHPNWQTELVKWVTLPLLKHYGYL